jgi:ABC-2 type transport system ATP-binding protein
VAIVKGGAIVAEGTPAELGGRDTAATTIAFGLPVGVELPAGLSAAPQPIGNGRVELATAQPIEDLAVLAPWALQHGYDLAGLEVRRPTLEDVYLELTA